MQITKLIAMSKLYKEQFPSDTITFLDAKRKQSWGYNYCRAICK